MFPPVGQSSEGLGQREGGWSGHGRAEWGLDLPHLGPFLGTTQKECSPQGLTQLTVPGRVRREGKRGFFPGPGLYHTHTDTLVFRILPLEEINLLPPPKANIGPRAQTCQGPVRLLGGRTGLSGQKEPLGDSWDRMVQV